MDIALNLTELTKLQAVLATMPDKVYAELAIAMEQSVALVHREVVLKTPTSGHGTLRQSIFSNTQISGNSLTGTVGSALAYAIPVELGTKPHFPPILPIQDWVKVKLGISEETENRSVAFLIARKIAKTGTPAVGMFKSTLESPEILDKVNRFFNQAIERVLA